METLRIYCITWNVETSWPEEPLFGLLSLGHTDETASELDKLPDMYFICLQEVRSQPQNFIMDTLFEEPWTTAFREVLGPCGYVRVTGERLQGIVTSIFVLRRHLPHLRDIHTAVTRTGLGGLWGNKGAACVRFSLYGCSICLVNCHLAAHDGGYEERCANFNTIVDDTSFPVTPTSNILYHDYVFWLGDLNFRFCGEMSSEDIVKRVLSGDLNSLIDTDELKKAQATRDAFGPLVEGSIAFPPTYKYQTYSASYDLSRRPAWTDRILHQVHIDAYENIKLGVHQTEYSSHQKYGQSDHKPVYTRYTIKVFAHHQERCVHFKPMKEWQMGGLNKVRYSIDADVETSPWDYIAIFKADFTSVHQYITYTYVPQSLHPATATTETSPARSKESQEAIPSGRSFQLFFNDELVQNPGLYVMLYYSGKYNSYLGMSDPFPAVENRV